MQRVETNLMLVDLLNEWNPFGIGAGNYETEIADTIQAVHGMDDPNQLAKEIQAIYEFSFEQMIPIDACRKMAIQLLIIKDNGTCIL